MMMMMTTTKSIDKPHTLKHRVDRLAISNDDDDDDEFVVVDGVDDAKVTRANRPKVVASAENLRVRWARICLKSFDLFLDLPLVLWNLLFDEIQRGSPDVYRIRQRLCEFLLRLFPRDGGTRIGQRLLRCEEVDLVLESLQKTKVIDGDHSEGFLAIAAHNDSLSGVLHPTGGIREVILELSSTDTDNQFALPPLRTVQVNRMIRVYRTIRTNGSQASTDAWPSPRRPNDGASVTKRC